MRKLRSWQWKVKMFKILSLMAIAYKGLKMIPKNSFIMKMVRMLALIAMSFKTASLLAAHDPFILIGNAKD